MRRGLAAAGAMLALVVGACSSSDAVSETGVINVEFDGRECSVTGPEVVPAGSVVPVVLSDDSDLSPKVILARLHQSYATGEVREFGDFAALQAAAGGVLWDDRGDVSESPLQWLDEEPASFDREARALVPDREEHQTLKLYELISEMGHDVIFVSTSGALDPTHGPDATAYWFCGPLEVGAAEF